MTAAELRRRVQPQRQPEAAVAVDALHGRHRRRCRPWSTARRRTISGVKAVNGNELHDQADQAGAGPRLAPGDAVLPGDPEEPRQRTLDPNGVLTYAGCGPYYFADPHAEQVDHAQAEPVLQGRPPAQRRRRSRSTIGNSLDVIQQNVESGTADYAAGGVPPDGVRDARRRSTASTRAGCSSSRSSASSYLAMNHDRPLFKNNPQLEQGRQLGDRPARAPEPGRLPRRQAQRPDPSSGPPGRARTSVVYPLQVTASDDREGEVAGQRVTPVTARRSSGRRTVVLLRSRRRSSSST